MKFIRWRKAAAAVAAPMLLALGLAVAGPGANTPAHALTGPPEATSYGAANLVSYADSDFESGVGNWLSYSNATISQGTGTTFLHNAALKDTVPAAGTTAFKLGVNELNTVGGNTYRVGDYLNDPTPSGDTVTFALGTYNSSGTFLGWVSSSAQTLTGSGYQYVHGDISVPSGVAYSIGLRETITGAAAGDVFRTDEVTLSPLRPALVMGGVGASSSATDWTSANSSIGPLQSEKEFNGGNLPTNFSGTSCNGIAKSVTCIITFSNSPTSSAWNTFISSIPANQSVIFVPHQEPENGDFATGAAFVSYFETEAALIRGATGFGPNIQVWQDSSGTGYDTGNPGTDCSYIVPPAQGSSDGGADGYAIDYYQFNPNGSAFSAGQKSNRWSTWQDCVATGSPTTSGTIKRPVGVFEFGYGVQSATCTSNPESTRDSSLKADATAFQNQTDTAGAPALVMSYWWQDDTGVGPCHNWNWPTTSTTNTDWQGFLTQNGGGAN